MAPTLRATMRASSRLQGLSSFLQLRSEIINVSSAEPLSLVGEFREVTASDGTRLGNNAGIIGGYDLAVDTLSRAEGQLLRLFEGRDHHGVARRLPHGLLKRLVLDREQVECERGTVDHAEALVGGGR